MKRRLRVLVTRPRGEAELFAVALAMRGHDAILAPLIEIALIEDVSVDLSGVQGVLFTSANGVRAFAHAVPDRGLPAFCVGNATANAARAAGFAKVESASGDVETLAALVRERLKPADGALVHAAGTVVAGDLGGSLEAAGFEVCRVRLYRAEIAEEDSGGPFARTGAPSRDRGRGTRGRPRGHVSGQRPGLDHKHRHPRRSGKAG